MDYDILGDVTDKLNLLSADPSEREWNDAEWTRRVKLQCHEVAKKAGCYIYASGLPGANGGEWMFDVALMNFSPETGIQKFLLVLESEWLPLQIDIEYDFLKLVVARADTRAMIFQSETADTARAVIDRLKSLARQFPGSLKGDQYLLSGWLADSRTFMHERFAV